MPVRNIANAKCKICGSLSHYQTFCPRKPRKPIKRTRIKPIGKIGKQWMDTRAQWLKLNNPPYTCHYCGCELSIFSVTLDHLHARSRRPDLRNELDNLVPSCMLCNVNKGSLSHDEYVHECH